MKLYGFWRSTATWRVRIALGHKGLAYEYVPVNLVAGGQHEESFRQLNAMPHVPVLELELDGQTRHIAESVAIIELLEELHPSPPLLPSDAFRRARTRQLALLVVSGIQPLQNLAVHRWVKSELGGDEQAWCRHWITRGLVAVEALARETAGRFAVGDEVSLADVCLVPQMSHARRFGIDLGPFPTLVAIDAACAGLPAFVAAHADAQIDAVKAPA
jgi:maleylpyruvate isomerase